MSELIHNDVGQWICNGSVIHVVYWRGLEEFVQMRFKIGDTVEITPWHDDPWQGFVGKIVCFVKSNRHTHAIVQFPKNGLGQEWSYFRYQGMKKVKKANP